MAAGGLELHDNAVFGDRVHRLLHAHVLDPKFAENQVVHNGRRGPERVHLVVPAHTQQTYEYMTMTRHDMAREEQLPYDTFRLRYVSRSSTLYLCTVSVYQQRLIFAPFAGNC